MRKESIRTMLETQKTQMSMKVNLSNKQLFQTRSIFQEYLSRTKASTLSTWKSRSEKVVKRKGRLHR